MVGANRVTMNFLLPLWLYAALLYPLWVSSSLLFMDWRKNTTNTCKPAPNWTIKSVVPMHSVRGDVVVVTLLKASLPFCRLQASKIRSLQNRLRNHNITEVSYLIVNAQETDSRDRYWLLKNRAPIEVPVFQQEVNKTDVWEILGGEQDDFLIYDRCGHLTYHIGAPWSFYFNTFVETAIRVTYKSNPCNCSITTTTVSAKARKEVIINEGIRRSSIPDPFLMKPWCRPHHYHH